MGSSTRDLDHFVDDAYLIALINDEPLPLSDEKYAEELTFQEALYSSSSNPSITHSQTSHLEKGESSNTKQMFCNICMDDKETLEMFKGLTNCNHDFCTDCITKYIGSKINENIPFVECPNPKCAQVIEPKTCKSILPKNVFERWETALFEAMIPAHKKFYCPYKDCSNFMVINESEVTSSECRKCKRLFCAKCRVKWHEGVTCEEFEKLGEDEKEEGDIMVFKLAKGYKWKRCTNCRVFIEKIKGCHHMICRCQYQFCYQCGDEWSDTHEANCIAWTFEV